MSALIANEAERLRKERDDARQDTASLLRLLANIRAAAGDPDGKLMQPELVAKIREQNQDVELLRHSYRAACEELSELKGRLDREKKGR